MAIIKSGESSIGNASHPIGNQKVKVMIPEAVSRTTDRTVDVAVSTTSGRFPDRGFQPLSNNQPVGTMLSKAAEALGLTKTHRWVARVDDREIEPKDSYKDNALFGKITIDWGPSEGGGGA